MDMGIPIYGKQQVGRPYSCPVYLKSLINLFEIVLHISRIFVRKKKGKNPNLVEFM